jgi:class 3 adenylate cyclase
MGRWWIRVGDADDYHEFDDLAEVADVLTEYGVAQVEALNRYGVACDQFSGQNYISLFWGDSEAQPLCDLTAGDVEELNGYLQAAVH